MTSDELEFAVFCVESTAAHLKAPSRAVYDALDKSGLLSNYIVANYDALHTQGKDYIAEDIACRLKELGVKT